MGRRRREASRLNRIIVVGGFFAGVITELIAQDGAVTVRPSRAELDVENGSSVRSYLREGDVIVDAAGPFQSRTTTLLEGAMELGAHVVDINESLAYARKVDTLRLQIEASGIAVLTACSAVSAVAAALLRRSGIARPVRVSALVAPASRETAHEATLRALLASVGAPIEVWREGRFRRAHGWRESRQFPLPGRRAYLVESALALDLPRLHPSLRAVDTWTDTSTPGANAMLSVAARAPIARRLARRGVSLGALLARTLGTRVGGFGLEIEDDARRIARVWLAGPRGSYRIAAAPAALAAHDLAQGTFPQRGVVPPDRHVDDARLLARLAELGIELHIDRVATGAPRNAR